MKIKIELQNTKILDIDVSVVFDEIDKYYYIHCNKYSTLSVGDTAEECIEEFKNNIIELYNHIIDEDDSKLDGVAQRVKKLFMKE